MKQLNPSTYCCKQQHLTWWPKTGIILDSDLVKHPCLITASGFQTAKLGK